jgi:hypothetical protein
MRSSCWKIWCQGLEQWGNWNVGDFQLLDGCVQGYCWLEGFWQWSIWIEFHMIDEFLKFGKDKFCPIVM